MECKGTVLSESSPSPKPACSRFHLRDSLQKAKLKAWSTGLWLPRAEVEGVGEQRGSRGDLGGGWSMALLWLAIAVMDTQLQAFVATLTIVSRKEWIFPGVSLQIIVKWGTE